MLFRRARPRPDVRRRGAKGLASGYSLPMADRLLVPSAALLWGLQFAFLNPALGLLLVALYDATPGEVGWVLAVYNVSGFAAALVLPSYADRKRDYLRPMLGCAALTVALAALLAVTSSLPLAVLGLVVLGGPAGVGSALLFAQLKHAGATPSEIVNTRAIFSFAWVAGPPLAALLIGLFGNRTILLAIATVAFLNVAVTAAMLGRRSAGPPEHDRPGESEGEGPLSRTGVALIVAVFVALQATNVATISIMTLFVTATLDLDVIWAGIALAVAAGLEIPALLLIGRLGGRLSSLGLVASGCVVGTVYYAGMAYVSGPVLLIALQVLNAWFVAVVAGVGLTLFQEVIARPGLASGLYANTRRVGAILSGPIIGFGALTALGYGGVFAICAALTALALVTVVAMRRLGYSARSMNTSQPRSSSATSY
jgi:MFS transporter, SET family, sugar efflux transporter